MTIIILTVIAIIAVGIGLFLTLAITERETYEELTTYRCEAIILVLVGIFVLLLALLFKFNPFW